MARLLLSRSLLVLALFITPAVYLNAQTAPPAAATVRARYTKYEYPSADAGRCEVVYLYLCT